jgi:L-alanine-DL-glutamate epimerase-like enolase superfamily enzyme
MKSGGIFKAERINALCEDAGIPCMVGSMVEARVANAAGAHFAAAKRNVKETDLDGYMLTKDLPFISGGFTADGGVIALLDKPGLGVEVDF